MSKYTENFPNLSNYDFDTIMCQLKQVCGADPSGLINAQFLSRPTTAKDIAQLFYCTKYIMDGSINLQNQYVELYTFVKDFFTNLDLKEEVNNWLEVALTDGTLNNIIATYTRGNPTVVNSLDEMTDHEKLYLLTSDGMLYYFNGENFVSSSIHYPSLNNYMETLNVVTQTNYETILPDLNEINPTSIYILNFPYGSTNIPLNMPYSAFNTQASTLITFSGLNFSENYPRQILIDNNSIYTRYKGEVWNDWEKLVPDNIYSAFDYITDTNYLTLLPDVNTIFSGTYLLNFTYGTDQIPDNLPYKKFFSSVDILICVPTYNDETKYARQILITGYGEIYIRFYNGSWSAWKKYKSQEYYIVDINGNGDYTSLSECIKNHVNGSAHVVIHVKKGNYDIIQEFTNLYPDFITGVGQYEGNIINDCEIICDKGTIISCIYTGDKENIINLFSPFKMSVVGGIIEGCTIIKEKCRYCIHDDVYNTSPYSKSLINKCILISNDSDRDVCIGGGFGTNSSIEVKNCLINTKTINGYGVFYHNSQDQSNSELFVHDNIVTGNIVVESYGSSENNTSFAIVTNNKCNDIKYLKEGNYDNVTLYEFNNVKN